MTFPKTTQEFKEAGYKFESKTHCRGCGAEIEFWLTPKGKHMPLDHDSLEPHWARCPKRQEFRK